VSQSTDLVAVAISITRAHERSAVSPAGVQPLFAESHSFPFSQTESRTRSSFVSIEGWRRPVPVGGCCAGGGAAGMSTPTTYSVDVDDIDWTGARLSYERSGP
jgi:hypothetical protein